MNYFDLAKELTSPPHPASWWQRDFAAFQNNFSPERHAENAKILGTAFNQATHDKTLASALELAGNYNLRYFIDPGCQWVFGYYPGFFVVGLHPSVADPVRGPGYIAHETAHALQDSLGLLNRSLNDFRDDTAKMFLLEAHAFGLQRASDRHNLLWHRNHVDFADHLRNPQGDSWLDFTHFYGSSLPVTYGWRQEQHFGHALGILRTDGAVESSRFEYKPKSGFGQPPPPMPPAELAIRLNTDFNGRTIFNAAAAPAFFKKILDPKRTLVFHKKTWLNNPTPLTRQICEKQGIDWKRPGR